MTTVIRENKDFEFVEDSHHGSNAIFSKKTNDSTLWNTGSDAIEEKKKILAMSDQEFQSYCINECHPLPF